MFGRRRAGVSTRRQDRQIGGEKEVRHMPSIASARSPYRASRIRMSGGIRRLICVLDLALEVRRERRMLLSMDDRALKDVGFNRSKACAEACRSFWDIPIDRLRL
jgi:uncharacterized protein YjiS (DUF1127 family)